MLNPKRSVVPKNPYPGFNTHILGRVAPLEQIKTAGTVPVEYESKVDELDLEKDAAVFSPDMIKGFQQGLGTMAATGAAGAAMYGIGMGIDAFRTLRDSSKYDTALRQAIQMSPSLQMHGYEKLKGYMPMIIKASPTVAEEPRLLSNYLESMLDAEGHMNMSTFAELTALEGNVLKNREMRYGIRDGILGNAMKGMMEGASKGFSQELAKKVKSTQTN